MNTLDKQYQELLQTILDYGVEKKDRTGTGTKSIFGYTIRHNMKEGFPLLTTKKMPFKIIVTELLWFLRGDTNIKYLVDNNCHIWDGDAYKNYCNGFNKGNVAGIRLDDGTERVADIDEFIRRIKVDEVFANKWGDLGPVYGKQWRAFGGYEKVPSGWNHHAITHYKDVPKNDQITTLINDLKTNPDSRRLMVSAWNVGELDQMVLPPCHYGFQVYTRELSEKERHNLLKKYKGLLCYDGIGNVMEYYDSINIPKRAISLMWNQRSVDTFLGLPFNIASYGLLLTILAKEVNMVPDELIGNLGDTHLYLNHIEQSKEQIGRELSLEERHKIHTDRISETVGRPMYIIYDGEESKRNNFYNEHGVPSRTREPFPLPKLIICDDMTRTDSFTVPFDELEYHLIKLIDYQSHPTIKAPLSN
jgi:thymidylate synthase